MTMLQIILVQCTNQKRNEKALARDLYDLSSYFRKQREYATQHGDYWYIQSAEHGLVHPDTVIEPYDTTPNDLEDTSEWAAWIAEGLGEYHPDGQVVVEVLGGKAYADPVTPALEHCGFDVIEPMRGLRIGERQQWLDEHTQ